VAGRFRFDDPDDLALSVQQVVGPAVTALQLELPHRYPRPGHDVHGGRILDDPAALGELAVDLLTGFVFGLHFPERCLSPSPLASNSPASAAEQE
jgi:hypothetical protein